MSVTVEYKCFRCGHKWFSELAPWRCPRCGYFRARYVTGILWALALTGCATQSGQVGSNASYQYERTAEGGCVVTVYSGREQIDTASIVVTEDCRLEASAGNLASGSTSEALIRVIDRLVPLTGAPSAGGAQ